MEPVKVKLEKNKDYYYCRCGKSADKIFCDGAHQGTPFTPEKFQVNFDKEYYLCPCKKSDKMPYCDGSHAK